MKLETKITLIITDKGIETQIKTPIDLIQKEVGEISKILCNAMLREVGVPESFIQVLESYKKKYLSIEKD